MKIYSLVLLLLTLLLSIPAKAQQSDNGDGTYTNPVIWADFPDNDVIRVGDTFYMVCTSMYYFPGVPILQSKDLVNWQYAANAIQNFKQHPAYDMKGDTRYGRGQWATSIRYHNGTFYLLFNTQNDGGYLCTAKNVAGPWKLTRLKKGFHDPGLFFDDDGKTYVIFGYSKLSIVELDQDFAPMRKDTVIVDQVQRPGLEGSHVYKINGYYYIYATYGGGDGYQVCLRSKNIYGPYEEKTVLKDDMNLMGHGIHQGALVETPSHQWWSIIFQDRDGVGRVPTLQPVTWTDGWPILGQNGRAVVTYKKPDVTGPVPVEVLPTSDEFSKTTLGLQWGWNHNPDESNWSLTERKGYLRLKTATVTHDLTLARNTLTQRTFGPWSAATIKLDIDHMKPGDISGLGVLQLPYAYIAVTTNGTNQKALMYNNGKLVDSVALPAVSMIYFKAEVNTIKDEATFSYSLDNKQFTHLGDALKMKFSLKMFTGNRFMIFNYATLTTGGYVDCDWFNMATRQGPPNRFAANTQIEAEMYDDITLAHTSWSKDSPLIRDQDISNTLTGSSIRFNSIDFKQKGYTKLLIRLAPKVEQGKIAVYLDQDLAKPYATLPVENLPLNQYQTLSIPVKPITGIHQVTLKFEGTGSAIADVNWFTFSN